eukprot:m.109737 g.109737  ORF g.109737 m.109737 type:complete len:155 (+) comp14011_c0_seq5:886-1350(+)
MGSFHTAKLLEGSFVANPPYDESMLQIMVERFIDICKNAEKKVTILFGLPGWGKYAPFPPLETADKSGFVVYHQLIEDRQVEWVNYFDNHTATIPSHHWYIMSNKPQEEFDREKIRDAVFKHWVRREPVNVKPSNDNKRPSDENNSTESKKQKL